MSKYSEEVVKDLRASVATVQAQLGGASGEALGMLLNEAADLLTGYLRPDTLEVEEDDWEYGWMADEKVRAGMMPRGPKILFDSHIYTPEDIASFPKGKRVRRRAAGAWIECEE